MADLVKTTGTTPSLASTLPGGPDQNAYLVAGEDLAAFDPCYIKSTDGLVWRASGAAATDAAQVHGYPIVDRKAGMPVELHYGVEAYYDFTPALTPGKRLYLGSTVGKYADAATTGGTKPLGHTLEGNRIFVDKCLP
jgi:hypothetical protein